MSYTGVLDLIGGTPLVKLTRLTDLPVYAKTELLNPGGSIKDRVAKHIIFNAENSSYLSSCGVAVLTGEFGAFQFTHFF